MLVLGTKALHREVQYFSQLGKLGQVVIFYVGMQDCCVAFFVVMCVLALVSGQPWVEV